MALDQTSNYSINSFICLIKTRRRWQPMKYHRTHGDHARSTRHGDQMAVCYRTIDLPAPNSSINSHLLHTHQHPPELRTHTHIHTHFDTSHHPSTSHAWHMIFTHFGRGYPICTLLTGPYFSELKQRNKQSSPPCLKVYAAIVSRLWRPNYREMLGIGDERWWRLCVTNGLHASVGKL